MKRIDIYYGGREYSVGGRSLSEIQAEIDTVLETGTPHWLEVNSSYGVPRPTFIRITPSTEIAFTPVGAQSQDEDQPEHLTP